MTAYEQYRCRFERAIIYVWETDLGSISRLPRQQRDREVLRRAHALAASGKRLPQRTRAVVTKGDRCPRM